MVQEAWMGTESTWALPVLLAQFPCEAKIALRNKDDLKGKKKNQQPTNSLAQVGSQIINRQ